MPLDIHAYQVKAIIIGRERDLRDGVYARSISIRVRAKFGDDETITERVLDVSNSGRIPVLFEPMLFDPSLAGEPLCTPSQNGGVALEDAP